MFLACFVAAEVLSVSAVAVHGRAVVMAVSRWPASAAAVVAVVASSPRCCAQCAIKFAHRAENTPKLVFLGLLGELCRGSAVGGAALGEYFRAYRHRGLVSEGRGALHAGKGGVFALHEAFQGRVVGVSEPHVVQFPRLVGECEGCCAQSADHLGEKR